jgi:hypothetical protein
MDERKQISERLFTTISEVKTKIRPAWRDKKKKQSAPVFKPYTQHQTMMLPPSLEELIPDTLDNFI